MIKSKIKRPISYYGGKWSIIRHILPLMPPTSRYSVYTEVFFGGGTVFFAKDPVINETINDKLDIVINFYRVIKNNFHALKSMIDSSLVSRTMHREAMDIIRNKDAHDNVSLAWAFWMATNFSYANKIGSGIKFSNHKNSCSPACMKNKKNAFTEHLVDRIENATIECRDAIDVLKSRNVPHAFHYIDPPYIGADQGHYKGYTEKNFVDLMDMCVAIDKAGGMFLLSHYTNPVLEAYTTTGGWNRKEIIHRIQHPRKSGPTKKEMLIWNYHTEDLEPNLFNL